LQETIFALFALQAATTLFATFTLTIANSGLQVACPLSLERLTACPLAIVSAVWNFGCFE